MGCVKSVHQHQKKNIHEVKLPALSLFNEWDTLKMLKLFLKLRLRNFSLLQTEN